MLLPRTLSDQENTWNLEHGAPFGFASTRRTLLQRITSRPGEDRALRDAGPFGLQRNSDTRTGEYPWAFHQVAPLVGLDVVEIGGSLSGFQFSLSKQGARVVNVDPGRDEEARWGSTLPFTIETMTRLNRVFSTSVELRNCTLTNAQFASNSVDRIVSISTIEHIAPIDLPDLAREFRRILRPGGRCVLTIDLFLDLQPFTDADENVWGRNIDIQRFIADSGLTLVTGETNRLNGFADFDPIGVLSDLSHVRIGSTYPVCVQALVLEKP
ncbi:MAG: class I SAM-dependent methyltransferase [Actinomycetes bacterium]